uniref:Uncharacterized protein n=1 Tax=Leersia perrieri TaxID=77586 RepID=A0A0D9VPC0_9ORYZ
MGCFLGCFGGAKERRRRRKRSPAQSPSGRARATPRLSPKKAAALDGDVVSAAAPLLGTLLELRDSTDDLCLTIVKKKVTFDPNDEGLLGIGRGEDEACESLFLLPIGKTKESSGHETGITSPEPPPLAPQPTRDANPVLSSVENFPQWKDAKTRAANAVPKASEKENIMADLLSEPAIQAKKKEWHDYSPSTPSKQEVSVDASLSTWLGSSGTPESNSVRSFSPISREDRPILGALTVEDIKISSANSSPRRSRSPSPNPDDMPILGTVGAYWNCSSKAGDPVTRGGFMRTRTRFGQDEMVNCY